MSMSADYSLYSSNFRIKSSDWQLLTEAARAPLDDYFDSMEFDVSSEHDGEIVFTVSFNGQAGDSFARKVEKFTNVIGQYLLDTGTLTLREDTSSDERDQVFFAGPTPESIRLAKLREHLLEAAHSLVNALPDGDDNRTPTMSAITVAAHSLADAMSFIEKSIDVERESRSSPAPEKSLITPASTGVLDEVRYLLTQNPKLAHMDANVRKVRSSRDDRATLKNAVDIAIKAGELPETEVTEQDQFIAVDTAWGEISLPCGAQFQLGLDGNVLVAASTREDGDADVLGSLNLQTFENRGASREATCAALERFVQSHPDADLFKIVDTVPDVLTLGDKHWQTDDDTDSTAAPVPQN